MTPNINAQAVHTFGTLSEWHKKDHVKINTLRKVGFTLLYLDTAGNHIHLEKDFTAADEMQTFPITIYQIKRATQHLDETKS